MHQVGKLQACLIAIKNVLKLLFGLTLRIFLMNKNAFLFMDMANLMNGLLQLNRGLIDQYEIRLSEFLEEKHPDFNRVLDFLDKFYARLYQVILEEGYD